MDKGVLTMFLKMLLSLVAVLSVFGGAVLVFRKLSGASKGFLKKGKGFAAKPLEILAFQNLGPGRNVYLLRCLDKKILVGATNTQISHLGDIVEAEDEDDDGEETSFNSLVSDKQGGISEQSFKKQISASLREISRV